MCESGVNIYREREKHWEIFQRLREIIPAAGRRGAGVSEGFWGTEKVQNLHKASEQSRY